MTIERPLGGRSVIETTSNEIKIKIPSHKNIIIIVFLSVFMFMWGYAELVLLLLFYIKGRLSVINCLFFGIWLTVWSIGGYIVGRVLLWNIAGKEIIIIRNGILSISKKVFCIGHKKEYLISKINNLHIVDSNIITGIGPFGFVFTWYSRGVFTFYYGVNTIRFGSGIDEIEGKYILDKIINSTFFN